MKILWYSDTPTCNTGFGIVARNLMTHVLEAIPEATIDIVGINEDGEHHPLRHNPRITITPAYTRTDTHGREKLIQKMIETEYDYVFMIHDVVTMTQAIDQKGNSLCEAIKKYKSLGKKTKFILYTPIDVYIPKHCNHDWLQGLNHIDTIIPYTYFAKEQLKNAGIETVEPMYHGVDTSVFYPMSRQQRKELKTKLFGIDSKRKVVSVVARNQFRKDIASSIEAFAFAKEVNPELFLYLHCRIFDVGGDLRRYLDMHGLEEGKDYAHAGMLDTQRGVPVERLNEIYNATDILLSSAWGEGFGLPYLEAMATKTAIVAPDNSVESELLPVDYLVPSPEKFYVSSGQDGMPYARYRPRIKNTTARIEEALTYDLSDIKNKCYNEAKDRFDWKKETQKLINILK